MTDTHNMTRDECPCELSGERRVSWIGVISLLAYAGLCGIIVMMR